MSEKNNSFTYMKYYLIDKDILDIDTIGKNKNSLWGFGRYLYQAFLAGCFVSFFILLAYILWDGSENELFRYVILSAIGSSAFLVFGVPGLGTSKFRNIFVGHAISALVGVSIYSILHTVSINSDPLASFFLVTVLASFLSVAFAVFLMVIFNGEHPPATGTALALAIFSDQSGPIWHPVMFILIAALFLGSIRLFLYKNDGLKAMVGLDSNTIDALKKYKKEEEYCLLTIEQLSVAAPEDIYKALDGGLKKEGDVLFFSNVEKPDIKNFKESEYLIFKTWKKQAKNRKIEDRKLASWTLRDLF